MSEQGKRSFIIMNVEYCEFPDDLYYDVENNTWFHPLNGSRGRMGVSSVYVFLSGKILSLKFRPFSDRVIRGQSIATVESLKYVGAVRSPVTGKLSALNTELSSNPQLISKYPYENWIVEYECFEANSLNTTLKGREAREALASTIKGLRIHCFKLLPDEDMYSIGTECTTTLANLSELFMNKSSGYVVHLVTDDPTADIEMVRWSMQTGNELVESRKEDQLYHFIVRKK
jgi:glycine cleavage system H protein